ncbi:MAG: YheC/YheD family protein [Syntrophomonadaceae bacterium]|nr:YheC/YheD family protein [Syntrophomonadaceae bacterium]MDD3022881.1 YheC/YheD family protein [Syntrophomonadaceae bacterium]
MQNFKMLIVKSVPKQEKDLISISKDLADYLEINEYESLKLNVGKLTKSLKINIEKSSKNKNTISLNSQAARSLYLSNGRKYGFRGNKDAIRIGPVVGIMIEESKQINKPFGGQSFFVKQLLASGRSFGELCFAFSPFRINWSQKTVQGYFYGEKGWSKATFPIPDVIYMRGKGYYPVQMEIRRRLEGMGVAFFNPALIGKWQTHRILTQKPELLPYIPDTRLIKDFAMVDRMIKKYQAVYLKPVTGSQGKNIVRVHKNKESTNYQYQYQMNNQSYHGSAQNLAQLRSCLRPVMGKKTYIIQKQINLLKSEGNLVDVRILVQKDCTGCWGVTGMACRVGRKGSITSNISAGGSGRHLQSVLQSKFPDEKQQNQITNDLEFVALEAAKTLEESIGPSGEMGIDIGIDKNGHIWFIEANLRPARQVFSLIGEQQTRKLSVERPMLYSRFLAGF